MKAKHVLASLAVGLSVWLIGCGKSEPPAPKPVQECKDPKILDQVMGIMSQAQDYPIEDMKPDLKMVDDLGVNGAARIQIRLDLQQAFGIDLYPEEIKEARTVSELAAFVEQKVAKKKK